ncbi:putative Serine-threonine protein kinase, plant-type [Hibiscus syriacus]|uniref:Serine-threonine protein kinase, plant-type n=1 Tax=Hibiscus syriacus TaxID=106335 RepID=A0A6A2X4T6_HIBSY|nr:putative Serine-threonine protein kinase, plant-type [Hibiscus syriacus]
MSTFILNNLISCHSQTTSGKSHFFLVPGMAFVKLFLVLLIFLRQSVSVSCNHDCPRRCLVEDKAALLVFKKSVLIDPKSTLADWEDGVHVCNFTGVTCDEQHHRVTQIDLSSSGLVAKISPFLSNLTALLNRNNLNGPIPGSFSLLTDFTVFVVMENNLTSLLQPSFFSNCTQLKVIDLSFNDISGRIPVEIGNCPGLWALSLYNNQFTGQFLASLTNTKLYNLDVEYNHLSGEMPSDLVRKLPDLVFLHLSYNNMRSQGNNTNLDPFFAALGNCTGLMELELAGMGLGGRLPGSICHCSLKRLKLQENRIFGSIPPEIGNLSNITMLNLTSNFLNGTIPEEFGLLLMLERLFLSANLFNSRIPLALGKLPHLGPLPIEFSKLENFEEIDLSSNNLNGNIFPQISSCIALKTINFSHNSLEGQLPEPLGDLKNLESFDVSSNNIAGNATRAYAERRLVSHCALGRNIGSDHSGNSTKSFNRECQVLKRIRHRNLIRIITACRLPDFKALVLPYMENGSLDSQGMAYLHHHSPVRVIHCDLKLSNVLLNDDMTALVSDFGIARLVKTVGAGNGCGAIENMGTSTLNMLTGSTGYIARGNPHGSLMCITVIARFDFNSLILNSYPSDISNTRAQDLKK